MTLRDRQGSLPMLHGSPTPGWKVPRARPDSGTKKRSYIQREGQMGERVLLASPRSLLDAASRTARPRARTSLLAHGRGLWR